MSEFKKRNGSFNQQLEKLEAQLAAMEAQEAQQKNAASDWELIHRELERELTFQEKINTALVATILEKITVKKESRKNEIHLDIFLRLNTRYRAVYHPKKDAASVTSSRSVDARGNSLWRTQGELLSSDYNHHTRICYTAMLMGGQAVREEVCYG